MQLWTAWLNAGHRVTAIGGSDFHRPLPKTHEHHCPEQLGIPSTYVYARELSTAVILESLRTGRAYISVGPQVTFHASVNGRQYSIGEDLGELGSAVRFTATASASAASVCSRILRNGRVVAEARSDSGQLCLHYEEPADCRTAAWYRLDVVSLSDQLLAITNPIFRGLNTLPVQYQYGDLKPAVATRE